jgi:hypothetical protein
MKRLCAGLGLVLGLVAVSAAPAQGAAIVGTLGVGGTLAYNNLGNGILGDPSNGLAIIDFVPIGGGVGDGSVLVNSATGYFDGVGGFATPASLPNNGLTVVFSPPSGGQASIKDITNDPTQPNAVAMFLPGDLPVINFLANFNDPDAVGLHFDLTQTLGQTGPDCSVSPVSGCVVNGIFKLTDSGPGVNIAFNVLGNFVNGPDSGLFVGQFGAEFLNVGTVPQLLALIATGSDVCTAIGGPGGNCTWSANFQDVASIPEPATMLTFGAGAALLAARRRRQARKNQN